MAFKDEDEFQLLIQNKPNRTLLGGIPEIDPELSNYIPSLKSLGREN